MAESVDRRLSKMQGDIDTLYRAVFTDEKPTNAPTSLAPNSDIRNNNAAQLESRIQGLENQIRLLTNQIERQGHELDKLTGKVSSPSSSSVITPIPNTTVQPLDGAPRVVYDAAFANLKNGRYEEAYSGFSGFLERWPNHSLSPNAQYWMAETLYVRGEYDKALREFAMGYRKWPNSVKAPDNLLKMALCLDKLGRKSQSCTALSKLQSDYKGSAITRRARSESKRMNCNI